jgi:hypothetical protein
MLYLDRDITSRLNSLTCVKLVKLMSTDFKRNVNVVNLLLNFPNFNDPL